MFLSIIVAVGNQNQIGLNNKTPWVVKDDLKNFKNLTLNHSVIFGRKTFESIGHPLKDRRNIILTKNKNYTTCGVEIINSFDDIFEICKNEEEVFICGGEKIYTLCLEKYLKYIKKMYISHIDYNGLADAFFPKIDLKNWKKESSIDFKRSENNEYNFSFSEYKNIFFLDK